MLLSVLLITYNHEKYISQALDSILMQKVNFEYEIVIGEDCSTDNTRSIIMDYIGLYPNKIRLNTAESNVGPINNFIRTYKSCKGKYIAMIDGDDFWTSPDKLQKQVDFLEGNNDFAIVFHRTSFLDEYDGTRTGLTFPDNAKDVYTIEDLLNECFLHTAATVCRNGLFGDFPKWFHSTMMYDWPTHVLNAQHGKIKCLNDIMCTYRLHGGGLWAGMYLSKIRKPDTHLEYIKFYKLINVHLKKRYDHIIRRRLKYHYSELSFLYHELAIESEGNGNIELSKKYAINSVLYNPLNIKMEGAHESILYLDRIKLYIRLFLPSVYLTLKKVKFIIS